MVGKSELQTVFTDSNLAIMCLYFALIAADILKIVYFVPRL